jgi:hypothetical protein
MPNGPRGFLVPLLYSEIIGSVPTRADLESAVRKVFWQTVVMQATGILCVSWQDGIENKDQQNQLVVAMVKDLPYRDKIASILQNEPHRVLFTREALVAVLRLAVAEGSDGNGNIDDQADAFTSAVLIANELLAAEIMPEEVTNGPADLLPTELRSAVLNLENPHDLLGRSEAFFAWSQAPKARASANYSDIAADFFRFTGMTPTEFMAGAYFTFARYTSMVKWDEVERLGVAFSIAQWHTGMADTRVVRQWIASNAVPLADVRAEWKAEASMSFAGAGSIWRRPIVQVEDDLFLRPSRRSLRMRWVTGRTLSCSTDTETNPGQTQKRGNGRSRNSRASTASSLRIMLPRSSRRLTRTNRTGDSPASFPFSRAY